MGTKRTRKTRPQLVVPKGGFASPILKWSGEAMPNRQKFAQEDREYNYLRSREAWLEYELTQVKPTVAQLSKLTREQRLAQLAESKAMDDVVKASNRLSEKLGSDDVGKAKKCFALYKAGDYDLEMLMIKYRKGSPEFKATLEKLADKVGVKLHK